MNNAGPVENNEEIVCDILTEIISTLFKMYTRLLDKIDYLKFQIDKENKGSKSKNISAAKAAVQIEMSGNSDDDIPE